MSRLNRGLWMKMVVILAGVFLVLAGQRSCAATDDTEFNDCIQAFRQSTDALTTDAWHSAPLDQKVAEFENSVLYGGVVIRWIRHKNEDGTSTIVALTRDPEPQPDDDPDNFDVILDNQGHLSLKDDVGANGFSFSKQKSKGVNGLLFCTSGNVSALWVWDGDNWH